MIIDLTAALAPILWALPVLLVAAALALTASVDPEVAEIYVGQRRLLFTAAVVVVVAAAGLAAFEPALASALGWH